MSLPSLRPALSKHLRPQTLLFLRQTHQTPRVLLPGAFFTTTARTMAPTQEWLIIIPDHPNTLSKRMEIRPTHLQNLKPHVQSGRIVFGGASLDEPVKEGEGMKANGSAMIVLADSQKEAEDFVREDVYAKEGVWDVGRMEVRAFKSAVRQAL